MPKKKKGNLGNLPHKLYCEFCDLSIPCPRKVAEDEEVCQIKIKQEDDTVYESEKQQNDAEAALDISILHPITKEVGKPEVKRVPCDINQENDQCDRKNPIDISQFSMEEKCELVRNLLLSEATAIYQDQEKATLKPEMTISDIAKLDINTWLASRHPLLIALCDGLSKVIIICLALEKGFGVLNQCWVIEYCQRFSNIYHNFKLDY